MCAAYYTAATVNKTVTFAYFITSCLSLCESRRTESARTLQKKLVGVLSTGARRRFAKGLTLRIEGETIPRYFFHWKAKRVQNVWSMSIRIWGWFMIFPHTLNFQCSPSKAKFLTFCSRSRRFSCLAFQYICCVVACTIKWDINIWEFSLFYRQKIGEFLQQMLTFKWEYHG